LQPYIIKRVIHGLVTLIFAVGLPLMSLHQATSRHQESIRSGAISTSPAQIYPPQRGPPETEHLTIGPRNISAHHVSTIPKLIRQGTYRGEKVKVISWPSWEVGANTAEAMHIDRNGIEESSYLESCDDFLNFDDNVAWLGDRGYGFRSSEWCGKFHEMVVAAQANRRRLRREQGVSLPLSWPIFITDWSDTKAEVRCSNVERAVGREFVFYSKRSIVSNRRWDNDTDWVSIGYLKNLSDPRSGGTTYRHIPLPVRTDIVETLEWLLREVYNLTLRDPIERRSRSIDVAHLWPVTRKEGALKSNLRRSVSELLLNNLTATSPGLTVLVDSAGFSQRQGRQQVDSAYVTTLLESKIIIATQRDAWEDHYRLFEALISGALVMTDRMLSLPRGLENGTSILEFNSRDELLSLIHYYLQRPEERWEVARRGRLIAMAQHRSWHRMEEIIFGEPLSVCPESALDYCPYVVHAQESEDSRH
jgi:hypothetical protein